MSAEVGKPIEPRADYGSCVGEILGGAAFDARRSELFRSSLAGFSSERVLLGDVFHAKNDAHTLCFTVISCKILSKIEVLSYFLINFVRSKPIPI